MIKYIFIFILGAAHLKWASPGSEAHGGNAPQEEGPKESCPPPWWLAACGVYSHMA